MTDSLDADILELLGKIDIDPPLAADTLVEPKESSHDLALDVSVDIARMACSLIEPARPISSVSFPNSSKSKNPSSFPQQSGSNRTHRSGTQDRPHAPFIPKVVPPISSSLDANNEVSVAVQRAKLLTFVCYGIYTSFISEEFVTDHQVSNNQDEAGDRNDLTLVFRVACIRAYGTLAGI